MSKFSHEMKSIEYISSHIQGSDFVPMPYSYANWICEHLIGMGFYYEDDQPPHFKMRSGDILITISPYTNIVVVDLFKRSLVHEVYFHKTIPQNLQEFEEFWKNLKSKL